MLSHLCENIFGGFLASNEGKGAVFLVNEDGELLDQLVGDDNFAEFGRSIVGLGDIDGDGSSDFAIGSPGADVPLIPCEPANSKVTKKRVYML